MIERPERKPRKIKTPPVVKYFGYVMVLIYFGLGAALIFTDKILPGMPQSQKNILGGLLLLYGLFRGYMVYIKSKKRDDYL